MSQKDLLHDQAVDSLGVRCRIVVDGSDLRLAVLVRPGDVRPFTAPWWRGKQVSLLAVDVEGRFILRHSGGGVFLWDRETEQATTLADSVADFIRALDWD